GAAKIIFRREIAAAGEPVVTTNAQEDPRFGKQESVVAYNLRSILCVPLKVKDVVTGVVYADNRVRTGLFNERDRDVMNAFANQAAVAIENARLFESVKQTLDEVTELKGLMDNVFASIASGVITTDVQDKITLCNRAAGDILGLEPEGILGGRYDSVLPPLDGSVRRSITRAKTQDEHIVGFEVKSMLPTRGAVDLTLNMSPLKDADQITRGVAIVVDDITERKKLRNKYELFQRMVPPSVVERLNIEEIALGGERQVITCLFADIRGFSTFSEYLDPVKLLNVLNRYLGAAADAVLMHEGTLDKFLGDAVMAVFNAPEPMADHTMHAVRAALTMRADIHALHEQLEPEFQLDFGVGIHVGEAVVGLVGTDTKFDYTAIGDSVNIAKRLQENSSAGQILLSTTAYEAVEDRVKVKALEPMYVKGREQPVQVFDLIDIA
ncbi:MAG: adenylate/guanylate cyclase domain-containing protein, partial [Anaerolineales bacterium]